jgi:hypothetical protein
MIDSARRLFHPTTIMAFQQLLELTRGTLFVADTVLHVKIEPLGPGNAILLTGPARGTAATLPTWRSWTPSPPGNPGVSRPRGPGRRTEPAELLPDYQPSTPGEDYFVNPDGFAYAYGESPERAGVRAARCPGLGEQFRRGQTPLALPGSFY